MTSMHRHVLFAFSAALLPCLAPAQQSAPAGESPHDRITQAASNSSLLSSDLKPWHLKLDATFYDSNGKNPYTGTIEAWHSGEDDRTVITVGSASRTTLHAGGRMYAAQSGPDLPALADDLLHSVLDPGPSSADIDHASLELHTESFGKARLDCIMLAQPIPHTASAPMGLFPTYCLDPGSDKLRASYDFGSVGVLRNQMGVFQNKSVAVDVGLLESSNLRAEGKITALSTFTPSGEFTPGEDLKQVPTGVARVAAGVIAGHILTKISPIYPQSARANHVSGTVVLHAIISRDGRIHSLHVTSAPDADLAVSAIVAVRQWTYSPYLLNGSPVEVDTTITVNYNLNPS